MIIDFSGGADADTLSLIGNQIGSIDFEGDSGVAGTGGNDTFINASTGKVNPLTGALLSSIRFVGGEGIDAFRNDGGSWKDVLFLGGLGKDRFQNNASNLPLVSFDGAEDDDVLENNGDKVQRLVFLGRDGADIFVNDGYRSDRCDLLRRPRR